MKLFIVFYLAGKIVFVSDQVAWPECQAIAEGIKKYDFRGAGHAVDDIRCEWHDKKPPAYYEPQPDFRFIG